jgi:hypothetical protein
LELHQAIRGYNGQGGLISEVSAIKVVLCGNPSAEKFADQLGVAGALRLHLKEHRAERKRVYTIMSMLSVAAGSIASYILDFIYRR